jgi:hypothetical protein
MIEAREQTKIHARIDERFGQTARHVTEAQTRLDGAWRALLLVLTQAEQQQRSELTEVSLQPKVRA